MILSNKIKLFLKLFILFVVFFFVFLIIHLSKEEFITPTDSYYHAKHSFLIAQSGQISLVKPWIEFNFLNYAPVDPWLGYHLMMAIFIYWFGLVAGAKIFASFLAALVFTVFYFVLKELEIKYSLVWVFLLFFSSVIFSFRLFFERPHLLSIIVLPLVLLFLIKGKNLWLFILSFFYTLCYHQAPVMILLVLFYLIADILINKRLNLRPLIASTSGILLGIIIHPDSLNYLYFMFISLVQTLFLKFKGVIEISDELQAVEFYYFFKCNFLALLIYIFAVVLFLVLKRRNQHSVVSSFLFLCSFFWFIVTLLLIRGIEYWLPVALLFAAVVFKDFIITDDYEKVKMFIVNKVNLKAISIFLISGFILVVSYNLTIILDLTYFSSRNSEPRESFRQINYWLKANTKKDSVVFYDHWFMWPLMFYYNDHNHYIIGIDPIFTYEYDKGAYWLWQNLSVHGRYCNQAEPCSNINSVDQMKLVPAAIKSVFRSNYVVVLNDESSNLVRILNNLQSSVKLVFKNKFLLLYEIK